MSKLLKPKAMPKVVAPKRGDLDHLSKVKINLAKKGIGQRRISRKSVEISAPDDFDLNQEKQEIFDLLENTKQNVFLTGKAGTGKSNFLKYFRAKTKKNVVVLAFTGVAAVNVEGQTIHSFFKFHPQTTLSTIHKLRKDEAEIYKALDLIVIDEISMVRADLLDFVDKFMRLNGRDCNQPFGGVQILAIGDLFQLPPVVMSNEKDLFSQVYPSAYFFDANSYFLANFIKKELSVVYRQDSKKQNDFICALDNLRLGRTDSQDLALVNTRCQPGYSKSVEDMMISLVSTNMMADDINQAELRRLSGSSKVYHGMTIGNFKEKDFPTAKDLVLKEGAQVMLLNNDTGRRWVNGDIVKVIRLDKESVRVMFDDGSFDDVKPCSWNSVEFVLNEDTGRVEPESAGSFTQLPLKLAWAITIHKSQGKTFDKVHIDFGRGTFAPGQAYVALSRARTLEGMILSSPLLSRHIFVDKDVLRYMRQN